jgi:predicted esterase
MLASAPAAAGSTGGMPADSPSAGAAVSGIPGPATPKPEKLPKASTACPKLTGSGLYTFGDPRARTLSVQIYIAPDARTKPAPGGPLILYWHGIGNDPSEVLAGFGQPAIDAVVERGGVVAAFTAKLCPSCGVLPDDFAWYNEDDKVSDHVVACAIEQASIDTRRIHAVGFSAGGIHTLHLAMSRSNYLASVVAYSGGLTEQNQSERQDPNNHVASLLAFGSVDLDVIVLNFNMLSWQWYDTFHALGWYTLVCPHGGAHAIPDDVAAHAYEFLLDHPYRVDPEPYAQKIPAAFPAYCTGQPVRP